MAARAESVKFHQELRAKKPRRVTRAAMSDERLTIGMRGHSSTCSYLLSSCVCPSLALAIAVHLQIDWGKGVGEAGTHEGSGGPRLRRRAHLERERPAASDVGVRQDWRGERAAIHGRALDVRLGGCTLRAYHERLRRVREVDRHFVEERAGKSVVRWGREGEGRARHTFR